MINKYRKTLDPVQRQSIEAPTYKAKPGRRARVTSDNITAEEFNFITDSQTLRDWAAFSLEQ